MRFLSAAEWGNCTMASSTRAPSADADPIKWSFFFVMGLAVLLVLWVDERFWIDPAHPHWRHVAPVKNLLIVHALSGVTALVTGTLQMSSRIRRRVALHRALGRTYIGAVSIAAPVAIYIGTGPLELVSMHIEQIFQGGLWWASALVAWACIRSGQKALHRAWMIRSYAFTLIFVTSRIPDAFGTYSDQFWGDFLWALVVVGALAPEIIATAQALWRIRAARASQARAAAAAAAGEPATA